jgi:dinuclear metal center YbgI/SA1388 family protein
MAAAPTVREILDHTEALLDAHAFADYCPIGLQVAGRATQVDTIATAVSCTRDVFERAAAAGAQLLLVHHGLFWKGTSQVIDPLMRERLAVLFDAGITMAGYHLSLDAHPELGNNALLADALELERSDLPFARHGGASIGIVGTLPGDGDTPAEFTSRVRDALGGRQPLVLGAVHERIRTVAVCTGGAAADVDEAAALGCDAFLTGEPREETHARAQELGITFLAGGHHATEVFGIRALGEHLAERFDLAHTYLDVANPV